ncbi:unnamed protein product [Mucor hiemalis]
MPNNSTSRRLSAAARQVSAEVPAEVLSNSPEVINLVSDSEEEVDFNQSLRLTPPVARGSSSPLSATSSLAPVQENVIPYPRDFSQDDRVYFQRDIMVRMPTAFHLMGNQMSSVHSANRFFVEEGVFYGPGYNIVCKNGESMRLVWSNDALQSGGVRGLVWRCTKNTCCHQSRVSVREGSLFAFRKIEINVQFMILYYWLIKCSNQSIGLATGADPATIRELIIDFQYVMEQDVTDEDVTIGGDGIIVEIDESKFGKRKYHRGDRVEGVWVVGGVERTEERKVFLTTVTNRNSNTMEDIIRKFVAPGSIIHTDCWAAYNMIERMEEGYTHYTVNHSEGFVAIQNGRRIHTNTIEGMATIH